VKTVAATAALSGQVQLLGPEGQPTGYGGLNLTLTDAARNVVAEVTTDGYFQFEDIPAGTYTLTLYVPTRSDVLASSAGSAGGTWFTDTVTDSNGFTTATAGFTGVTLGAGDSATGYSFLLR
jgi:hypothetical protein